MSTPLFREIRDEIVQTEPIGLARYMALCLGHPLHGYYRTRDPLGATGDFVTAPEISQMFGELIGLWAAQAWMEMGAPHVLRLVELGPGRGTMMADALRATRIVPKTLAANWRSMSASVVSSKMPMWPYPALLTRMSMRPNRAVAASTADAGAWGSVISRDRARS